MKVVILAAGYGTRLYPLTENTPKPLIEIHGKPIINYLIEKIKSLEVDFSIKKISVVSNDKFYKNFLAWKETYKLDVEILNDGSRSQDRLGAIKDIKFAMDSSASDWLVLGGDNLFEDNLKGFMDFAKSKKTYPLVGLYDLKSKDTASRYGVVGIDQDSQIVKMEEKPTQPFSSLVASCIYFFPKTTLKWLEEYLSLGHSKDASGQYIKWIIEKTKVYGYVFDGRWVDIGHIDTLREAERDFKPQAPTKSG